MQITDTTTSPPQHVGSTAELDANVTCIKCRFFDAQEFEDGYGYCRRYPPTSPVMEEGSWHWYFVEVAPYEWCGEFREATSNTEAQGR